MIKKVLAIMGVFGLIYVGCYTGIIEGIFGCGGVAQGGGLLGYLLLGIIASVLILKK